MSGTFVARAVYGLITVLAVSGSIESGLDQVEVYRKPAQAGIVEEERRKVGEIAVKSAKLEVTITFE